MTFNKIIQDRDKIMITNFFSYLITNVIKIMLKKIRANDYVLVQAKLIKINCKNITIG